MATAKRKMSRRKPVQKTVTKAPSKGLGDDIEKITEATGIKKIVELFTPEGKDCGCDKRKEILNKLFPRHNANCFTKEQYEDWPEVSKTIKTTNQINHKQQKKIIKYLRSILNMSVTACGTCDSGVWVKYIDMLDKVADTYKPEIQ